MARSAKQAKAPQRRPAPKPGMLQSGATALGAVVARNPAAVGGTTAFMVALFYVSANALWYQPHAHLGAFFATRAYVHVVDRSAVEPETTILIERPEETAPPVSDPTTAQVQSILKDLNFYQGTVDGLAGPATTRAVQNYQQKVGLAATGRIDGQLLEQLGASQKTSGIAPLPTSRDAIDTAPADPKALNMKVQAGLKAFGNDDIEIDGVLGGRTKAAIEEFQALFGLKRTGLPDAELYAKMKEIGLTN